MKIFISQPMQGKTNEEIKTERERLIAKARERYGEDIEVIDSFFENAPADARPLWFLGKSLELLSTADVAVFAPDWKSARGCPRGKLLRHSVWPRSDGGIREMKYKIYISPEDRASNVYASSALWNGHTTNEKEQMGRCADYMERGLLRCGSFEVINAQYGNMYDRVKESNNWPSDMHVAPHTNGFNGKAAGTRVHCYPSDRSRRIGKLIQDRIAPLSPGAPDKLVESTNLYELRATHMAAVLPEFGFHDNPEDAQWLVDNMGQIAEETVQAICEYFGVAYVPPAEDDSGAPAEPATPEEKENALYRVQIGAFRVLANAEAFRAKAEAGGL